MKDFEEFIESFGFNEGPFIIAILCILVLLGNFMGGLIGNILLALRGRPIFERSLMKRTSFRLALASEVCLVVYIIYYHAFLVTELATAQIIFWLFTLLAAPLLAVLGAQSSYLMYAKKIDVLKARGIAGD